MGNIEKFRVALLGNIDKRVKPNQPVFKVKPTRSLKEIWKETVPDQPIGGEFKRLLAEEALWVTIDDKTYEIRPVLFGEMSLQLIDYFVFFQRAKEAVQGGIVTTPVYLSGIPYEKSVYRHMQITPLTGSYRSKHWRKRRTGNGCWKEQHFRQRVFNALKRERLWVTADVLSQLRSFMHYLKSNPAKIPGLPEYLAEVHSIYQNIQDGCDNQVWLLAARTDLNISAAMLRDNIVRRVILSAINQGYAVEMPIVVTTLERLYTQGSPVFTLPHGSL